MPNHIPKHTVILGLLALVVAVSLIYSFSMLRVGNFAPDKSDILVPPTSPSQPVVNSPSANEPAINAPVINQPAVNAPVSKGDCRPSGCSGQICSDQDMVSDCMYREEYACYKTAKCERQADGQCGWTYTAALAACLDAAVDVSEPEPM